MRITEYLTQDHQRLHALLERARGSAELDREAYASFRKGLLRHIGIEEKVLFPAVRRRLGSHPEPVKRLRVEHAAITSLLVPTPDHALAGELAGLLDRHDGREEGQAGVYATCEAALGEASEALGEQAAAYPEVPVNAYYDGPRAKRTAAEALAAAEGVSGPYQPPPALLLLGLALAGLGLLPACQHPAARPEPAPASAAAPVAPSNPVQAEMQLLHQAMQVAVTGVAYGDVRPILPAIHRVHQAKQATEEALESGAYRLKKNPDQLERFKELDEAFHQHLAKLAQASQGNDVAAAGQALGEALQACTGCHSQFRP